MKKELFSLCAALALVGCDSNNNQGGVGDDTTVDRSTPTSSTDPHNTSGSLTNTNVLVTPQITPAPSIPSAPDAPPSNVPSQSQPPPAETPSQGAGAQGQQNPPPGAPPNQ